MWLNLRYNIVGDYLIKKYEGKNMNVANVVILLGCRSSGCSPTEELKGRVKETVNLYRSLKEKAVIIPSGGVSEDGCGLSEAEFMLRELLKYNIPRERIFLEEKARTTIGNAFFSKLLIESNNIKYEMIHIVSSCYHMDRSELIFKSIFSTENIGNRYCFGDVQARESEIDKLKRDSSILEKMKGKSVEYIENTFKEYL